MNAVEVSGLGKTYDGQHYVLGNVSLAVGRGDFFALLGPNGAGKSTLISILTSLVKESTGTIHIMGINLALQPSLAKQHIGVVPQEVNLNVFEKPYQIIVNQAAYYGLSAKLARQRALLLLQQVDLLDKKDTPVQLLSGGMKRRLMIARALVHDPEILILDEPSAGVDVEIRHVIWDLLRHLNQQGKTIILTTHYLEEAEMLCKNIAILHHGKIIAYTSMQQLLADLERETLVLYLQEPCQIFPQLVGFTTNLVTERVLEVSLTQGQNVTQLIAQLQQQQIVVERIKNKTNRLEVLFMNLINANSPLSD